MVHLSMLSIALLYSIAWQDSTERKKKGNGCALYRHSSGIFLECLLVSTTKGIFTVVILLPDI
jgi:hypothetical protein